MLSCRLSVYAASTANKTYGEIRKASPGPITACIREMKVPSEFSRCTRSVSETLKAEELRNLSLFYFPAILDNLPDHHVQTVWAYTAFVMRLYYSSDEEFDNIPKRDRNGFVKSLLSKFVSVFGERATTYNFHLASQLMLY